MDFGDGESFAENTWINRPDAGVLLGPLRHPLGMFEHLSDGTGFDPSWEKPIFVLDVTNGAPLQDVEHADRSGSWLVSRRAKELFETIDPAAFAFLPVDTFARDRNGDRAGPEYFLCDVVRFVDALDESRSRVRVTQYASRSVALFGADNVFKGAEIAAHSVFRLMFTPHIVACTESVRDAWGRSGLTRNIVFRPLGRVMS